MASKSHKREKCIAERCSNQARSGFKHCYKHGGGLRCTYRDADGNKCNSSIISKGLCKRHGGGKRCVVEGCSKSARALIDRCIRHSKTYEGKKPKMEGKRCMEETCEKQARVGYNHCHRHGGGKRCAHVSIEGEKCNKSIASRGFCKKHGGGRRCVVEGCSNSARALCDTCIRHGGETDDQIAKLILNLRD